MHRFQNKKNDKKPSSRFLKRGGFIYIVFIILILTVFGRFFWLQFMTNNELIFEADRRSLRKVTVPVFRGMIKDREGRALAVSVEMFNVWADPKIIQERGPFDSKDERWIQFSKALDIPLDEIEKKVNRTRTVNAVSFDDEENTRAIRPVRFVYIKKLVTPETVKYIKSLKLKGIGFDRTTKRFYPYSDATAQLIGLTNKKQDNLEEIGEGGIEFLYNELLMGESGARVNRGTIRGQVIEEINVIDGKSGEDVELSIDAHLQSLVFNELKSAVNLNKADSGTAVLLDIETGEILAMTSYPSYNPNNRKSLKRENIGNMNNRAIVDLFEPGSTIKPFIVAAALEQKIADTSTVIDTRPFILNRKEIRDVSYNRQLDLEGILVKSSNVGVTKLALQMDPQFVVDFYGRFGIGKPTNLGLNGESSGIIATNKKRWAQIERATYSYGYGFMVTPLQLARAYAVIGSYGQVKPVSILKVETPPKGEQVISRRTAETVLRFMQAVAEKGASKRGLVPNYTVGIKTGTAKKLGRSGQYENKYIAYTAGIAPISNPKFTLVVVIDNPTAGSYYGGTVSAPVFSNIMGSVLRAKNVPPDKTE